MSERRGDLGGSTRSQRPGQLIQYEFRETTAGFLQNEVPEKNALFVAIECQSSD